MEAILSSNELAKELEENIISRVKVLSEKGATPKLAIVRVGENPNDISYEKSLLKKGDGYGIDIQQVVLEENISTEELKSEMEKLNVDESVTGIILFRPLPKHIDEELIQETISWKKDVDCMSPLNLAKIFQGDFTSFQPATPFASMKILEYYNIDLTGKTVAIINRSMVLGKPLAMMVLGKNGTPIICHSKTKDLKKILKEADVVVTATGRAKSLKRDSLTEDSIVIDVGVSLDENGKLSGDADFEDLKGYVKGITPRLGGVGKITSTLLMEQLVTAKENSLK
ncbi:bifunctional 5,10-methylenetetrahydrofolate dehydrogenase/5,10-methenyltetrahydrofolate cyclohydrolase [Miniphocaeibacter halophilus]|uniref:Bifunctional 5,10-methylenetetrahydrofolate dehydrogenase/5,10-methenyltetrahydrofolate cyclohydrolase n=1 Tax=Miniphocaeibacter halophilus TaxID=2931922 RepID=A0AC61MQ63_9FIRM|nr:bifunctional 5,10-methylenetetrahydrofolate dehydrogenase/5,10-methenyltetrahydrofolate cyclohydrolase [Miniphocaeibacter halophilus]QQK07735.1 bifunctional 5,10-methylenetetrahydrofolate dehydrogenase/5,10-methenyltetrahydrofolate cyclohydrolase [Miniphocaeibacter halophilus]